MSATQTMSLLPPWAPNLHPLIVHFPIVLVMTAAAIDVLDAVFGRVPWLGVAATALYLAGALATVAAYLTGVQAGSSVLVPGMAYPSSPPGQWAVATMWDCIVSGTSPRGFRARIGRTRTARVLCLCAALLGWFHPAEAERGARWSTSSAPALFAVPDNASRSASGPSAGRHHGPPQAHLITRPGGTLVGLARRRRRVRRSAWSRQLLPSPACLCRARRCGQLGERRPRELRLGVSRSGAMGWHGVGAVAAVAVYFATTSSRRDALVDIRRWRCRRCLRPGSIHARGVCRHHRERHATPRRILLSSSRRARVAATVRVLAQDGFYSGCRLSSI